jgi:hypothetical protein
LSDESEKPVSVHSFGEAIVAHPEIRTMNPDPPSPRDESHGSPYGEQPEPWARSAGTEPIHPGWPRSTTVVYSYKIPPPEMVWQVEHDRDQGVFRLTGPDGQTECFRDQPVGFLVVELDAETGQMKPEIRHSRPRILYLCRSVGH